jgi:predicted lipid-binding transport protein (Tim44 family)
MGHMADIIILAIISLILGLKLFSVLGQKKGGGVHKGNKHNKSAYDTETDGFSFTNNNKIKEVEIKLGQKLDPSIQLQLLSPSFNKNTFLNNAKEAFKMILESYAEGDTHTLSKLLNVEMMKKFAYEITKKEEKKHKCTINIVKINNADIKDIKIKDAIAEITVDLNVEVVNYISNQRNKVISGHKTKVEKRKDIWTFNRNLKSPDPAWSLINVDKLFA